MGLRIQKFCCCCTNKTGSLIIGTLGWILTLVEVFSMIDPNYSDTRNREMKQFAELLDEDDYHGEIYQQRYARIGYCVAAFIVSVCLIYGIYKKNKMFILPWLVLKAIEAIITSIAVGAIFIFACTTGQGVLFLAFFITALLSALIWYFWICVWSHYMDLSENVDSTAGRHFPTNSNPPEYSEKMIYNAA